MNEKYGDSAILPCICMNKDILYHEVQTDQILEDYKDNNQVMIWLNDYDDREVSIFELEKYKELINSFYNNDVKTINMYGSYYSICLSYYGLNSFSSGIALSHKKNVDSLSSGGGLPLRYYEPTFKMEIMNEEIFTLYSKYPELFVCDCPVCRQISSNVNQIQDIGDREELLDPFFIEIRKRNPNTKKMELVRPAIMDWTQTRLHFLYARKKELEERKKLDQEAFKQKIIDDYTLLNNTIRYIEFGRISRPEHLMRWHSQL